MSIPFCSNCLKRISNCECDGDYLQIFGEQRVDEIKVRADERQKVIDQVIELFNHSFVTTDVYLTDRFRAKLVEMKKGKCKEASTKP